MKLKVGEVVLYQNGDSFELGIVKVVIDDENYFINYHTGDTSAKTHIRNLHKLRNDYAFDVRRKSVNEPIIPSEIQHDAVLELLQDKRKDATITFIETYTRQQQLKEGAYRSLSKIFNDQYKEMLELNVENTELKELVEYYQELTTIQKKTEAFRTLNEQNRAYELKNKIKRLEEDLL